MWVVSMKRLRDFWNRHPEAEMPLRRWYKIAENGQWASIHEVRKTFPHADLVTTTSGTVITVFNVGGNKYRIIARMEYHRHKIYIKEVLSHVQYSRENWKDRL